MSEIKSVHELGVPVPKFPFDEGKKPTMPCAPDCEMTAFTTGAVRSKDKDGYRYDLVSPHSMKRLARVFDLGSKKYGDFNWEKGMPISDILNHALAHIYAYLEGEQTGEDDLAHAAWNLLAALHMEETHRDIDHQLRSNHPLTLWRQARHDPGAMPVALTWVIGDASK